MYHGVHSRHRSSVRWAVEAAVPIETLESERRLSEPYEVESSALVARDGLTQGRTMDSNAIFDGEPSLGCTRSNLAQEASPTPLPPLTPASPLNAFPQLLTESDLECPLCCRLLYLPITTRCGHSYCKSCFMTAMQYSPNCPLCRQEINLEQSPNPKAVEDYSISFVLASLIEKSFPKQYAERCEEDAEEEKERKKPKSVVIVTPVVANEDLNSCAFQWDTSNFFSNCLGSGCFALD